ncbi:sodium/hydrogen exchanger 9B2-like isoform X2 [Homalodisca vitripennis]|uniref:sodium/hydrogen exchanger 9B2-like isoform X2 n=1 Tax=Homalodisca vitripennis TaxID=197043 RepID=UPI001EEB521E|nr:sodium/hydrogen exchanger 9B2-like isoform X2 [Homalodisca vitripennis]
MEQISEVKPATPSEPLLAKNKDVRADIIRPRGVVRIEPVRENKSKLKLAAEWVQEQLWDRPHSCWQDYLTLLVLTLVMWLLLVILFGDQVTPSGDMFRMLVLILCAAVAAPLTALLRLPPLLGMLFAGIILRTVGFYHVSGIYLTIVANLRQTAMTVILIKAGLGLDPATLIKLSLVVVRLGMCPCTIEAITIALIAVFLLGWPWLWALVLGFLLCAISPAVVVPTLLDLKERGYGEDKGIPTLVLAACSLDDITAISMFSLFLGMIFSTGDLTHQILQGPTDILVGLVSGILWGIVSGSLPHRDDDLAVWKRSAMVGIGGLCAILGAPKAGFPSAGPLACVTIAFVASVCWKTQGPMSNKTQVADVFSILWRILEPMLYAFIGAEIDLTILDLHTVTWGAAVITGALLVRLVVCWVVLLGAGLNWKEIFFVGLAWLPKATVQAALAPLPLTMVQAQNPVPASDLDMASQILTVAVLSILITSPLGAIGTTIGGPRLLKQSGMAST